MDEVFAQRLIDTGAFRPVQDFVDAEKLRPLSDFDPKVIKYYTVDGKLWAMPIAIAVPLLFYNKIPFREVGLDPEKPPQDLDEVDGRSRGGPEARLPWQRDARRLRPRRIVLVL